MKNKLNDDDKVRLMLGYLCIVNEAEASLVRKVEILDRFKLDDADIAQICACTLQSVRSARLKGRIRKNVKKNKA